MRLIVTTPDGNSSEWVVPSDGSCVLVPDDPDARTQAERNADNAISAARLVRVEARLRRMMESTRTARANGVTKVEARYVAAMLQQVFDAPIEP